MSTEQSTVERVHTATTSGPILIAIDDTYAPGEALLWSARVSISFGAELVAVRAWRRGLGNLRPGPCSVEGPPCW